METGPPTRNQPKAGNGWRQSTLTVPTELNANGLDKEGPTAPPRRKRSSMASPERRPGGFKDLFGNNMSRRASVDSVERPPFTDQEREALQQRRRSKSFSNLSIDRYSSPERNSSPEKNSSPERTMNVIRNSIEKKYRIANYEPAVNRIKAESRLQRKVSKVGNKKSDKFFGENLSDCLSDEPITPDDPTEGQDLKHLQKIEISKEPLKLPPAISQDKLDIFVAKNAPLNNVNAFIAENTVKPKPISVEHDITLVTKLSNSTETSDVEMDIEVDDKDEHKTNLDKKAEFLMAMLDDENLYKEVPKGPVVAVAPPRRRHSKEQNGTKEEPVDEGYDTVDKFEKKSADKSLAIKPADYDDEQYYKGMTPVVEPIIVPKRKITKHICDDDDHIHKHIHSQRVHSHEEAPAKAIEITQSKFESPSKSIEVSKKDQPVPIKPKRDFNVYEKTVIVSKLDVPSKAESNESEVKPEVKPRTRHYSHENLITASTGNDGKSLHDFQRIHSFPVQPDVPKKMRVVKGPDGEEKLESILKKCKSSQSFLTQDLMNQIVDRVYGFHDPYSIDHSYDDGSSQVSPSSKLTTRKISVNRKESTIIPPIKEDLIEESRQPIKSEPAPTAQTTQMANKEAEEKKKEEIDYAVCKKESTKLLNSERLHAYSWDILAANREIKQLIMKDFTTAFINTEKLNAYPNDLRAASKKEITCLKISRDATIDLIDNEKSNAEPKIPVEVIAPATKTNLNESFVSGSEPASKVYYITMREASRNFLDQERIHAYSGHSHIPQTINFLHLERLHSHPGHHRAPKQTDTSLVKHNGVSHLAEDIQKILQSEDIDDETITHVLDDIYTTNSGILDDFQDFLSDSMPIESDPIKKKIEISTDDGNGSTTIIKIKQKQNAQKEPETSISNGDSVQKSGGNRIAITLGDGERRDSIVEVDQWFLKHNDLSNRPRRGSESQVGYNTRKIFPFGKLDKSHTGASEFFENKALSKSADNINEDSELNQETTNNAGDRNSIGHSTLLKYLK